MTLPGFHACQMCMGTGGVRIPCAFCRRGDPVHPHVCAECGGAGQVPDDDTVGVAARAIHQRFVDENSQRYGIDIPAWEVDAEPWKEHMRSNARAALFAYARHTQETK